MHQRGHRFRGPIQLEYLFLRTTDQALHSAARRHTNGERKKRRTEGRGNGFVSFNFNTFRFSLQKKPISPCDPAAEHAHKFLSDEELGQRTLWLCLVVGLGWSTLPYLCPSAL